VRLRARARPPPRRRAAASPPPAASPWRSVRWGPVCCWPEWGCVCACAGRLAERAAPSVRESDGPAATEALGAEVAAGLRPGDVVLVSGELGTGKTTFVRG